MTKETQAAGEELLPNDEPLNCPFCHRIAITYTYASALGSRIVGCGAYYCAGRVQVPVEIWNTRHQPNDKLEALEAENKALLLIITPLRAYLAGRQHESERAMELLVALKRIAKGEDGHIQVGIDLYEHSSGYAANALASFHDAEGRN